MDVEFKGKNMFLYSRGVKRQQGSTTGVAFYVYNVIVFNFEMDYNGLVVNNFEMDYNGLVVIMSELQSVTRDRFPGGKVMICSLMFDIVNLLFKNNGGETEDLFYLFIYFIY